jgi:hypothetical protein
MSPNGSTVPVAPYRLLIEGALVSIAAVWVVMSFTYPFGWDQGLFAWVGGVIVHGGMPYRDAWEIKGPLLYYIYALAEAIFGVHLWSIRVLDVLLLLAATAAVARAATHLTSQSIGRGAALVYFLWYASHSFWNTAQPDGWAGMLLILALTPAFSSTSPINIRQAAVIGICVGLITLFKPIGIVFLVPPIVYLATIVAPRRLVSHLGVLVAGWLTPLVLMGAWFFVRGALDELITVHLKYSALYVGLSPGDPLRGLVDYFLLDRVVGVALPLMAYGGFLLWRRRRPVAVLLLSWAAVVAFSVVLQNRFYAYHWLPMLPAATVLAAVAFDDVRSKSRPLAAVLGGIIVLHIVAPIVLEEARFAAWMAGVINRDAYYDAYGEPGDDMKAVRWLRTQGQPGEIFPFGWQSGVAWLSERDVVSRFGYSLPLMMGKGLDVRASYRRELLDALRAMPPRYILVGTQSEHILGEAMTVGEFPELADLVDRDYREVARIGKITIHEIAR